MSKGRKRLGIVLAVPYFVGWIGVGLYNYIQIAHYDSLLAQGFAEQNDFQVGYFIELKTNAENMVGLAAFAVITVPIVTLIALAIGLWVYRGFRPKGC